MELNFWITLFLITKGITAFWKKEKYCEISVICHKEQRVPQTVEKTSGKTSGKIIQLILQNSSITISEMALQIGIAERSVERNIRKLQTEGKLKRVGPAKGGYWLVVKSEE